MEPEKPPESQGIRLLQHLFRGMGKRIFTMDDAKKAADFEKIPQNQLAKILSHFAKRGWVQRLRRGVYVSIGILPGAIHAHANADPFLISAYLIQPSAISHWSALQYHGLTDQIPLIVTASTTRQVITPSMRVKNHLPRQTKHVWEIHGKSYEYIHVQDNHFFGIENIWLDDLTVQITDKERTLLDVFIYQKMFGGFGGALGILEDSLPQIDVEKLIDYAIKYDKKSLAKRLGWALEYFGIPENKIEPLLNVPIAHYCRLDQSGPAKGPCDKRWMIQKNLQK
jgi:predicted transcriptional regulator of viral defense system